MDENASHTNFLFCTCVNKNNDQTKYVCFVQKTSESIIIGLTNAEDVWRENLSKEATDQLTKQFSLKSTVDIGLKLKSACVNGSALVSLEENHARLHVGSGQGDPSVSLPKLSDSEAKTELQKILFKMADCLSQESRGAAFSPVKSPQKRNSDYEPKKHHTGQTVTAKRRLPGDSLINPGTRRKRPATGVAFDDGEDA